MTNNIISEVTRLTGITYDQMCSASRVKEIVNARQGAMWLVKKHTNLSLKVIGSMFGSRDHSTVIHSLNAVNDAPPHDKAFHWVTQTQVQFQSPDINRNNKAPTSNKLIGEDYNLLEICG
jgi:chromosomal replication initiation ATPase DnaA